MTNFERYLISMTEDELIGLLMFQCDVCPVPDCKYRYSSALGSDCEEVLKAWGNS